MKEINLLQLLGLVPAMLYITSCYGGEWHTHGNYIYFFEDVLYSWNVSIMKCEDMNASLLTINDEEENDFIERHAVRETPRLGLEYWIGLTTNSSCNTCGNQNVNNTLCLTANDTNSCCECRCQWQWIDGSHITFMKWQHNEPTGGNFCGALKEPRSDHYAQQGWYWYEDECSDQKLSICKKVFTENSTANTSYDDSNTSTEYTPFTHKAATGIVTAVYGNTESDATTSEETTTIGVNDGGKKNYMQRSLCITLLIALAVCLPICFASLAFAIVIVFRRRKRKCDKLKRSDLQSATHKIEDQQSDMFLELGTYPAGVLSEQIEINAIDSNDLTINKAVLTRCKATATLSDPPTHSHPTTNYFANFNKMDPAMSKQNAWLQSSWDLESQFNCLREDNLKDVYVQSTKKKSKNVQADTNIGEANTQQRSSIVDVELGYATVNTLKERREDAEIRPLHLFSLEKSISAASSTESTNKPRSDEQLKEMYAQPMKLRSKIKGKDEIPCNNVTKQQQEDATLKETKPFQDKSNSIENFSKDADSSDSQDGYDNTSAEDTQVKKEAKDIDKDISAEKVQEKGELTTLNSTAVESMQNTQNEEYDEIEMDESSDVQESDCEYETVGDLAIDEIDLLEETRNCDSNGIETFGIGSVSEMTKPTMDELKRMEALSRKNNGADENQHGDSEIDAGDKTLIKDSAKTLQKPRNIAHHNIDVNSSQPIKLNEEGFDVDTFGYSMVFSRMSGHNNVIPDSNYLVSHESKLKTAPNADTAQISEEELYAMYARPMKTKITKDTKEAMCNKFASTRFSTKPKPLTPKPKLTSTSKAENICYDEIGVENMDAAEPQNAGVDSFGYSTVNELEEMKSILDKEIYHGPLSGRNEGGVGASSHPEKAQLSEEELRKLRKLYAQPMKPKKSNMETKDNSLCDEAVTSQGKVISTSKYESDHKPKPLIPKPNIASSSKAENIHYEEISAESINFCEPQNGCVDIYGYSRVNELEEIKGSLREEIFPSNFSKTKEKKESTLPNPERVQIGEEEFYALANSGKEIIDNSLGNEDDVVLQSKSIPTTIHTAPECTDKPMLLTSKPKLASSTTTTVVGYDEISAECINLAETENAGVDIFGYSSVNDFQNKKGILNKEIDPGLLSKSKKGEVNTSSNAGKAQPNEKDLLELYAQPIKTKMSNIQTIGNCYDEDVATQGDLGPTLLDSHLHVHAATIDKKRDEMSEATDTCRPSSINNCEPFNDIDLEYVKIAASAVLDEVQRQPGVSDKSYHNENKED